uniref:Uncharacterized protein n=1 Tax=Micrurus lemniscatus lemniscatus TaxID=129467 RepID=A0A2D4HJP4_MICLE
MSGFHSTSFQVGGSSPQKSKRGATETKQRCGAFDQITQAKTLTLQQAAGVERGLCIRWQPGQSPGIGPEVWVGAEEVAVLPAIPMPAAPSQPKLECHYI